MKNTRLFKYLKSINNKEWNSLNNSITAKYSINSDAYKLFQFILKHKGNLNHHNLEATYVQNKILKGKTKKNISNACSVLTDEIKQLLVVTQLEEDPLTKQLLLLKALNKRGLHDLSHQHVHQVNKQIDNEKIGLWNSLHRQLINHHFYFSQNPLSNNASFLQKTIDAAKLYHQQIRSLYKFEAQNCISLNRSKFDLIEDKFDLIQGSEDELSNIFSCLNNIVKDGDPLSAIYIEQILINKSKEYSSVVQLIMYIILRGFYSREVNKGKIEVVYRIFNLQKFMIENKYIFFNNKTTSLRFITIVSLAAFIGENKWGREFVEKYGSSIVNSERKISISISEALLLFAEKKYTECIQTVNQIYAKSVTTKSILNRLELIAYIELYEDNKIFLKNRLDNYRLFNIRNKKALSNKSFAGSNNLHKILTMIVNGEDKKKIRERIQGMELLFYRVYLHQKLKN